jgi:hypothetical protein
MLIYCSLLRHVPPQLIFSIRSQGGTVVASATTPDCQVVAGSKRYVSSFIRCCSASIYYLDFASA